MWQPEFGEQAGWRRGPGAPGKSLQVWRASSEPGSQSAAALVQWETKVKWTDSPCVSDELQTHSWLHLKRIWFEKLVFKRYNCPASDLDAKFGYLFGLNSTHCLFQCSLQTNKVVNIRTVKIQTRKPNQKCHFILWSGRNKWTKITE